MKAPASTLLDRPIETAALARPVEARPKALYWSVRRELWQNRSIVFGPLAAGFVLLASFLLGTIARPERVSGLLAMAAEPRHEAIARPYGFVAAMVALGGLLAGVFYCLDSLQDERRDRSILFWKSLPVSDATTVLSKACIPFVVLPLLVFAITLVVQSVMLLVNTLAVLATGGSAAALWRELPLLEMPAVLLYGTTTLLAQQAPLYAWVLMVSAAARGRVALWAFLPFAIAAAEQMVLGHSRGMDLLRDLLLGAFARSFALDPNRAAPLPVIDHLSQLDPAAVFGRPGVWIGLGMSAVFIATSIWLRLDREPV
jgi:ABC-2 type transport system permease protein